MNLHGGDQDEEDGPGASSPIEFFVPLAGRFADRDRVMDNGQGKKEVEKKTRERRDHDKKNQNIPNVTPAR
ncbi:hypothetical protein N7539_007678 [Penicillium diatomitis]|uniref:Uncharacterized protein n=1 Tax=Penicillium diatomitis TaxID=2819901 RepID=A0A9W9WVK2_9EURO|nr:uncharacterized protein N7539_007678 [Penicillium diatomitis]KAJ5477534.1 hypothetical protein N7539_007678 [Penicillium diatomitis]